jgi:hypothetical protein
MTPSIKARSGHPAVPGADHRVRWAGAAARRAAPGISHPAEELHRTYFRSGHAHAGTLVTLAIVTLLLSTRPHSARTGWSP